VTLAERGYGVWAHDSWYSLGLYRSLGYESYAIRIGIAHYNSAAEVEGLLGELASLAEAAAL
jgi:selenocysteine lyase/cysteine desulfurase